MEHGIVPRPRFTKCPTAYCAPTRQGQPVPEADRKALEEHDYELDAKRRATSERMSAIQTARWAR